MSLPAARRDRLLVGCAAIGALVLLGMWLIIHSDPRPGIDHWGVVTLTARRGSRIAAHARSVAWAGSGAAFTVTAVAIVYAAHRRRWGRAASLIVGFPLTWEIGDVIKHFVRRPRPPYELISAHGPSFPSTDSAISVGFVVVAATLAGGFVHRASRVVILSLGLLATAATGILTIVFGDHYLTDVLAGWGLGALVFSLLCSIADRAER